MSEFIQDPWARVKTRNGLAGDDAAAEAVYWMKQLNQKAAQVFSEVPVHACTDITGFGLAGHLSEMTRGSRVDAEIDFSKLPFMHSVKALALAGAIPGGTKNNLEFYKQWIRWQAVLSDTEKYMFCDAQTSGGLLVSIPEQFAAEVMQALQSAGIGSAAVIGRITKAGDGIITVI